MNRTMKVLIQKPKRTLKEQKKVLFKQLREEQSPPEETPESQRDERKRLELNKTKFGEYSYILGHIDGRIIKTGGNPNQEFYGASMNKPMLALANLILCSDKEVASDAPIDPSTGQPPEGEIRANRPRCLNIKEINGLINYGCRGTDRKDCWGDWRNKSTGKGANVSNELSRALSGARYKFKKGITPTQKRAKSIEINLDQIKEVWKELGLEGIDKVHHNGNRQTVMGVFKFLSFLNDPKKPYPRQRQTIVNAMKTPFRGHDSEWFREISKVLTRFHIPTKNIYGKGGFFGKALNFGITIDNKWIFVVYSSSSKLKELNKKSTGLAKKWGKKLLHRIMVDALWSQEAAAERTHTAGPYPRKGSGHPDFPVGVPKKSTCKPPLKYVNNIPGITFIRARGGDYGTQEMIDYLKGLTDGATPPTGGWVIGDLSPWNCKKPLCTTKRYRADECWPHGGHTKGNQVDICLPMKGGGSSCAPLRDAQGEMMKKPDGRIRYDFSTKGVGGTKATAATLDIEKSLEFLKYTLPKCTYIGLDGDLKDELERSAKEMPARWDSLCPPFGTNAIGGPCGRVGHEPAHKDHFHVQGIGGGSAYHGSHDERAHERAHSAAETKKRERKASAEALETAARAESKRLTAQETCKNEYYTKRRACGRIRNMEDHNECIDKLENEKEECLEALKEEKKQMSDSKSKLEEHLKEQIKAMLLENIDMLNDLDPSQDSRMILYEGPRWNAFKDAIGAFGKMLWSKSTFWPRAAGRAILDRTGRSFFKNRTINPWELDYPAGGDLYPNVPKHHPGGPVTNPKTGATWKRGDANWSELQVRVSALSPQARAWRKKWGARTLTAGKVLFKRVLPGTVILQQVLCTYKRFDSEAAWRADEGFWGQRKYDIFAWVNAAFTNWANAGISQYYNSGLAEDDPNTWPWDRASREDQAVAQEKLIKMLECLNKFELFKDKVATYLERLDKIAKLMYDNRMESKNYETFKIAHNELDRQRMTLLKEMANFMYHPTDAAGEKTGEKPKRLPLFQKCGHVAPELLLVAAGGDPGPEGEAPAPPPEERVMDMPRQRPSTHEGSGTCAESYAGICLKSSECGSTNLICHKRARAACAAGVRPKFKSPYYGCSGEFAGVPYMCVNGHCKGAHAGRYGKELEKNIYIALADGRKTVPTDGCKGGDKWTKLLTAKWLHVAVFSGNPEWVTADDAYDLMKQLNIPDGDFGTCWPNKYKDFRPRGWKKKIKVKTKTKTSKTETPPETE